MGFKLKIVQVSWPMQECRFASELRPNGLQSRSAHASGSVERYDGRHDRLAELRVTYGEGQGSAVHPLQMGMSEL